MTKYVCRVVAVFTGTESLPYVIEDFQGIGADIRSLKVFETPGEKLVVHMSYLFENGWGKEYTESRLAGLLFDRGGDDATVTATELRVE